MTKTKILPFVRRAAMLLLLGLFALTARAQDRIITGYTATSGTAGVQTEENYDKLVDGNRNTKWCITSDVASIFTMDAWL